METVAAALYSLDLLMRLSFQVLNREVPVFSRAISDFGLGKTARLFRVYVMVGCLAPPLLAWQFWASDSPAFPAAIPVYLGLVALGRLGIAVWPDDPHGAPQTEAGHIHRAATILAFTCAYMTVVEATPQLGAMHEGLRSSADLILKHTISASFLGVVLTMSPALRPFFGLAERAFLYSTGLWFLLASLTLPPL